MRELFVLAVGSVLVCGGDAWAGPGAEATVQVTLGEVVDVLRKTAARGSAPDLKDSVRAARFATNLKQLLDHADQAKMPVEKPGAELVGTFVTFKEVQWKLIFEYFTTVMVKAWPALSKVNWWLGVVAGVAVVSDANVGAGFEFCDPKGLEVDVGHRYVVAMLANWEPGDFGKVLERRGCAASMLGYFVRGVGR